MLDGALKNKDFVEITKEFEDVEHKTLIWISVITICQLVVGFCVL